MIEFILLLGIKGRPTNIKREITIKNTNRGKVYLLGLLINMLLQYRDIHTHTDLFVA